jgi:hypothetical protein
MGDFQYSTHRMTRKNQADIVLPIWISPIPAKLVSIAIVKALLDGMIVKQPTQQRVIKLSS